MRDIYAFKKGFPYPQLKIELYDEYKSYIKRQEQVCTITFILYYLFRVIDNNGNFLIKNIFFTRRVTLVAVCYTHLTLPTKRDG